MLAKRRPTRSSAQLLQPHRNKLTASKSTQYIPQSPHKNTAFTFRKNIRKTKQQTNQPYTPPLQLYVPNQQLSAMLNNYPLRRTKIIDDIATNQEAEHLLILSRIQQFSQYYGKVLKQIGRSSNRIEWVLVCRAVNSIQLQNQFNRRYQAFTFVVLPSLIAAVNRVNFGHPQSVSCVGWAYFERIVNWQTFANTNAAIIEQTIQSIGKYRPNQNQLWIISESTIEALPLINNFYYYFLDEFSIQMSKMKVITQRKQVVYVMIADSSKVCDLLITIPDSISEQQLRQNLLTASQEYIQKLINITLKDQPIYCLINFPPQLIHQFAQRPQYFTTADHPDRLNHVDFSFIRYGASTQPYFKVVQFNPDKLQEKQIERVMSLCKQLRQIRQLYSQLKTQLGEYQLAVLHLVGNQQLQQELQYFLSTKLTVVQQIKSLFETRESKMVLFGRFSKIQADSLCTLNYLSLVNLKQVPQSAEQRHHKIIELTQQAILEETKPSRKAVTFCNQDALFEQQTEYNQDSSTRCFSSPNLGQTHNKIFILVPKTVPHHSLLSRSIKPYTLLLYSSVEEVRQVIKHIETAQTAYILTAHKQSKFIERQCGNNVEVVVVQQLSERTVREQVDLIIQREFLQLKKGKMLKSKKRLPAVIVYDQAIAQQTKLIDSIKSTFQQAKPITINRTDFNQLTSQFQICEVELYQLGQQQHKTSTKVTTLIDLFAIYMNPIYSHIQFTPQHLRFSNRLFWLKYCKDRNKKDKLRGKLNDVCINRVHSPRSRSLKNIDLYISQKGITIMHNCIPLSKISKAVRFRSKLQLISVIFDQNNKGNHSVVVLSEEQYQQLRQLCQMKVDGILWIIATNNHNLCIVRQPTLIFCLPTQLQSIVVSVTQQYRTAKNKQFQLQKQLSLLSTTHNGSIVTVYFYAKWKDYLQQKSAKQIAQTVNLVKNSQIESIQMDELKYAIFYDEHTLNSSILYSLTNQQTSTLQEQLSQEQLQTVFIVLHVRHHQLVNQTLQIINQTNCTLITLRNIQEILLYTQLCKTITVLQAKEQIRIGTCLWLQQSQTSLSLGSKLAAFIRSVRTST